MEPLFEVVDPSAGPIDSVWARTVFDLAQILELDLEELELGATLLRWAARHGSWSIESVNGDGWYLQDLLDRYASASQDLGTDPDGPGEVVATTWLWPPTFDPSAQGDVRVEGVAGASIEAQGDGNPGASVELAPGTYDLVVTADGYEPVTVQREVLPGVTTVLSVRMTPVLTPAAASLVTRSLVQLRLGGGGQAQCTNGIAWRDGLVLTSLSGLPATSGLDAVTADGVVEDVEVAQSDEQADLAILRVEGASESPVGASPVAGDFAWAVFRDACGAAPATVRGTLAGTTSLVLAPQPSNAVSGAPLVDRSGELLGLLVESGRVVPLGRAETLAQLMPPQVESGGFPFVWVGLGAAAVGAALALWPSDPPTERETGGVVVIVPMR